LVFGHAREFNDLQLMGAAGEQLHHLMLFVANYALVLYVA
jgi:hypothetical protein